MPTPRISVVIPCYNAGSFLPGALESLAAQTFRDFETIIVDDGSTDPATIAFLDGLGPEIRLIRQENRGLSGARNTGYRDARAPLILPFDCDDRLHPEFLARTLAALEGSERCFAFSWLALEGEKSGLLAKEFNLFEQLFLNQLPYALLLPKAAWHELGGYDESMRKGYEDWDFNIRLGLAGWRGIAVPEPLFRYRVSASGMLQSVSARRHGELWAGIQAKQPETYRLPALVGLWRAWRRRPSTYPLALYFAVWFAWRLLPRGMFNRLFHRLRTLSHSERVARRMSGSNA